MGGDLEKTTILHQGLQKPLTNRFETVSQASVMATSYRHNSTYQGAMETWFSFR